MRKIDRPWDLILHFIAGLVISSIGYPLFSLRTVLLGYVFGASKELWDVYVWDFERKREQPLFDWADLVATVIGSIVAIVLLWLIVGGSWL